MSRKNPSSHSDEQFALFVEKMRGGIAGIDQDRFREMVGDLARVDLEAVHMVVAAEPLLATHAEGATESPAVLPLIGHLVLQWCNSQNLLIRLLALLLGTDSVSAAVIFEALGTTHLRLDLIRRLALLKVNNRRTRDELGRIIDDFDSAGRRRNELIYGMYPASDPDEIARPQVLHSVSNDDSSTDLIQSQAIGQRSAANIIAACDNLRLIDAALELLIPRLNQEISAYGLAAAAD